MNQAAYPGQATHGTAVRPQQVEVEQPAASLIHDRLESLVIKLDELYQFAQNKLAPISRTGADCPAKPCGLVERALPDYFEALSRNIRRAEELANEIRDMIKRVEL